MRHVTAVAMCLVSLACAGCTTQRPGHAASRSAIVVGIRKEPISLNPLLLEGITAYAFGELLYSYLTNYDENGRVVAGIARDVPSVANGEISHDGRQITFRLRHDVRWQDGTPVTSRDVAFTYAAIMNPANNVPERYGYDHIAAIRAPDPYSVVLLLKRPFSPIVPLFFGGDSNYPILPAHLLAPLPNINAIPFNASPIGSGPYRFAQWHRGDRIELNANASYYARRPRIARLVLPFVQDDSTAINQLHTGELDAAFLLDASRVAELRSIPNHRVVITPVPYFYALSFNFDIPLLADANVRRAIVDGIDRTTLTRKITGGVYDGATGMRGLFTWAYDPGAVTGVYDPAGAQKLLASGGWMPGPDGIRVKGGHRLSFQLSFPAGSDITTRLATAIAAAERSIGVEMTLRQYDRNQYISNDGPVMQGRYDVSLYDYQGLYDPDASWLLACDQRAPRGFNVARYCNDTVDALLRQASTSYDRTTRIAAYHSVQKKIAVDLPYDFICQISEVDVIPDTLHGYARPLLSPFNSVASWYWDQRSR